MIRFSRGPAAATLNRAALRSRSISNGLRPRMISNASRATAAPLTGTVSLADASPSPVRPCLVRNSNNTHDLGPT